MMRIAMALGLLGATAATTPVPPAADPVAAFLAANKASDKTIVETPSGLQYKIFSPGDGAAHPTDDDVAVINYEGRLADGTVFDKSPRPIPLPVSGVVPGFSEALKLMSKGARYRVWIKPNLGYGDTASGPIPAHSVLVFDIQLLTFLSSADYAQLQAQAMDRPRDDVPAQP